LSEILLGASKAGDGRIELGKLHLSPPLAQSKNNRNRNETEILFSVFSRDMKRRDKRKGRKYLLEFPHYYFQVLWLLVVVVVVQDVEREKERWTTTVKWNSIEVTFPCFMNEAVLVC